RAAPSCRSKDPCMANTWRVAAFRLFSSNCRANFKQAQLWAAMWRAPGNCVGDAQISWRHWGATRLELVPSGGCCRRRLMSLCRNPKAENLSNRKLFNFSLTKSANSAPHGWAAFFPEIACI
ncbi:MAG: hypothetical protein ABI830_08320, partial [Pseudolabrys sp.]